MSHNRPNKKTNSTSKKRPSKDSISKELLKAKPSLSVIQSALASGRSPTLDQSEFNSLVRNILYGRPPYFDILMTFLEEGMDVTTTYTLNRNLLSHSILFAFQEEFNRHEIERNNNGPLLNEPVTPILRNLLHLIEALLDKGVPVNHQDYEGQTALHLLCIDEYMLFTYEISTTIMRTLLERGAEPNLPNKIGETPLHIVLTGETGMVYSDRGVDLIELLLEHGADVNVQSNRGYTPAHYIIDVNLDELPGGNEGIPAARLARDSILEFFMLHGMDPTLTSNQNQTLLNTMANQDDEELVQTLADYNAQWKRNHPNWNKSETKKLEERWNAENRAKRNNRIAGGRRLRKTLKKRRRLRK